MLTQVDIYNSRNDLLSLPTFDNETPYKIIDIQGLDPIKASIITNTQAAIDGGTFQNAKADNRNIVLTASIVPDYATESVAELRQALYAYFMPKSKIRLRFLSTHMETVEIEAYVESCVSPIFTKDPAVQISLICPQPYFKSITPTTVNGASVLVATATTVSIDNPGSIDTPILFSLNNVNGMSDLVLENTSDVLEKFVYDRILYDPPNVLTINTTPGSKSVYRGTINELRSVNEAETTWIQLKPGSNEFRVTGSVAGETWSLVFSPLYGGL